MRHFEAVCERCGRTVAHADDRRNKQGVRSAPHFCPHDHLCSTRGRRCAQCRQLQLFPTEGPPQ